MCERHEAWGERPVHGRGEFGLRNFYLDGAFVYECSPMICLVQVPRGPVPRDVWFQFLLSES